MAIDRRRFMKVTLFGGLAAMGVAAGTGLVRYLYPEVVHGRRVTIAALRVPDQGAEPRAFEELGYKFYLVQLEANGSGSDGLLFAFSRRCTFNGCTITWNEHVQSGYGEWRDVFRCPCCGSVFTRAGLVALGPATLPLEQFDVRFGGGKAVVTLPDPDMSLAQYR
jgi:Rieske Fe-S protein